MSLEIGQAAPEFTCNNQDGQAIKLSDYRGQSVILYFYPKDDTPGCTQESCDFRDLSGEFKDKNAVIIGVSKDPEAKHIKFREKYGLPFELLSDVSTELCQLYGVWVEKKMFSNRYMGIERSTFLIDPEGNLQQIWRKVRVKNHAASVLKALQT